MGSKKCYICGDDKSFDDMIKSSQRKGGVGSYCRECEKKRQKQYREENKEKLFLYGRKYREKNREKMVENGKAYREENKEKMKEWQRQYYQENKEVILCRNIARRAEINQRRRLRYSQEPEYKLMSNMRKRIWHALKGGVKSDVTMSLIGCSIGELKNYIECQFVEGMTWGNYGEWHVDHIRPCASFDFSDPEQQRVCFHFTNLQPLWAVDNFKKHASY